jgi:uncharacterized Zn-binding protein involved in type VI secretion
MPAVTRLGDISTGHCYTQAGSDDAAQTTVFANSILATVVGAHYPTHTCGVSSHEGFASTGSGTVFIESKQVHRIGDEISCGDISANGSQNVFVGN